MQPISKANIEYLERLKKSGSTQNLNMDTKTFRKELDNIKADTLEISKPARSKVFTTGLILAAAVAMVLVITKGRPITKLKGFLISHSAKKIQSRAQEISQTAKKEYASAVDLVREGKANDYKDVTDEAGNIIRKYSITPEKCIMQELSGEKILKETDFSVKKDGSIDINKIIKNLSNTEDTKVCDEIYKYKKGAIQSYAKNGLFNPYGTSKVDEIFEYDKEKLVTYNKNFKGMPDGLGEIEKIYGYEDGKFAYCLLDSTLNDKSAAKPGQMYLYNNEGKLSYYRNFQEAKEVDFSKYDGQTEDYSNLADDEPEYIDID